jgi:hypothetical protein
MQNQQSPDVHQSNPWWVLKTVEANQPHETYLTSLPPLQPTQCSLKMWENYIILSMLFSFINLDHMESHLHKYNLWWMYFRKCLVKIFTHKCILSKQDRVLICSIDLRLWPLPFHTLLKTVNLPRIASLQMVFQHIHGIIIRWVRIIICNFLHV